MTLEFERLIDTSAYPYPLLLLADETMDAIEKHIFQSEVYGVQCEGELIGGFCLLKLDDRTVELKNIAIAEHLQGKGIGSLVLDFIKRISSGRYETLVVGTADATDKQINFYQKNGFKPFGIRRNFFIENYPEPIFENGIQLKDMVLLKFVLQ